MPRHMPEEKQKPMRFVAGEDLVSLKTATRLEIKAAGKLETVERFTRVSKTELARYYAPDSPQFMPIDVLADLLMAKEGSPVLVELAELGGYSLYKLPSPEGGVIEGALALVAKEASDVFACAAEAIADGRVDRLEARKITKNLHELIAAAVMMAEQVQEQADADT